MASKPMTTAAAIMVASNSRPAVSSQAASAASNAPRLHSSTASTLTELEHEVQVDSLKVDSLAVLKIIKHAREAAASGSSLPASGQLLGLDSAGVLNVSDAFPLPSGSLAGSTDGEERRGPMSTGRYTSSILPRLSALGADANVVGFYCSTSNGQHLATPGFLETLIAIQIDSASASVLKNVKPAPGAKKTAGGKGVAIVFDLASSSQGTLQLKAYRLSNLFIETYRSGKFDSQNLAEHRLTVSNFLEEVPLAIQSSALLTAFFATMLAPSSDPKGLNVSTNSGNTIKLLDFLPSLMPLGLPSSAHPESPAALSEIISSTITSIETHNTALNTLSFQSRQLARDRARLESVMAKHKADNETRAQQGLPPLPPPAEEAALQEPSRLETMCALSGIDSAAKKLTEASGLGFVRAYGAKAGVY